MFDFERQLSSDSTAKIVASRSAQRTLAHRQQDVYDSHRHRTFSLALYMTGSEIEAEEILTNTFIRAFQVAEEPVCHQVDSALLEELRLRLPVDVQEPPAQPLPGDSLAGCNVLRTELEEAIQNLPPSERLAFLLRDVEGYDIEGIAELLQKPPAQVSKMLFSARIRLRRILAEIAESRRAAA